MSRLQKNTVILALWVLALCAGAPQARAISYLSGQEALDLAFPQEGVEIKRVDLELSEERAERYEQFMHRSGAVGVREPVFYGVLDGKVVGYAMILTESSRYRPITFLVALNPDASVRRVDVMIYREPRGGEVVHERFLNQYNDVDQRVRLGREIRPISGATVSGQVMTFGVNKAIFFARELRAQLQREAARAADASESQPEPDEGENG